MCWDFGVGSDGTKNTEFRPIENLVNKGDEHEDLFFDKNDSNLKKYATEKKDQSFAGHWAAISDKTKCGDASTPYKYNVHHKITVAKEFKNVEEEVKYKRQIYFKDED